jgi:uncharacterized protein (DUF433 family)
MGEILQAHITKTAGVCGGKACISGHRIRVLDIVVLHEHRGHSPDEIVGMFPGLTLSDVHAALAYYFDRRAEIQADMKCDADLAERLRPLFPSKLQERLRG